MERYGAQTQPPLRLLSLDGGGVRGYSMLLLLQDVMVKLFTEIEGRAPKKWEVPRPCDHFDLIGGTGTGGLIAMLLGRLRLDVDTALELYAGFPRRVFQTDKTVAGVPYRKTLYKASKLEEALKEVVRLYESNDTTDHRKRLSPTLIPPSITTTRQKRSNTAPSVPRSLPSSNGGQTSVETNYWQPQTTTAQYNNEDALLYDERPGRCKTFMTAVYKGSKPNTLPALLRTYDSSTESPPSGLCKIWEAGRATCATFPAFKGIQIGQNLFLDEGTGRFNPAPLVLDEAIINEWPGREVGVLVSVGSGKLPPIDQGSKDKSHVRSSIVELTPLQKFVEARENHATKIGDCEKIHLDLLHHLMDMGVDDRNYFRLNVDYGVGGHGMGAYTRMADISTCTRAYLARPEIQMMNRTCAEKLAAIHRQKNHLNFRGHPLLSREILDKGLPELPKLTKSANNNVDAQSTTSIAPSAVQHSAQSSQSRIAANIVAEFNTLPSNPFSTFDVMKRTASPGALDAAIKVTPKRKEVPPPLKSTASKGKEGGQDGGLNTAASHFSDSTTSSACSPSNPGYSPSSYSISTSSFSASTSTIPTISTTSTSTSTMVTKRASALIHNRALSSDTTNSSSEVTSPLIASRSSISVSSFSSPMLVALSSEQEDEEVAQHLAELTRIALKIENEAQSAGDRVWFRGGTDVVSVASERDRIESRMGERETDGNDARNANGHFHSGGLAKSSRSAGSGLSIALSSRTESRLGDRILGDKSGIEEGDKGMVGTGFRMEERRTTKRETQREKAKRKRGLRISERLPISHRSTWVPPDSWDTVVRPAGTVLRM